MSKWEKVYQGDGSKTIQVRPVPRKIKPVKWVKTVDGLKRECDPSR